MLPRTRGEDSSGHAGNVTIKAQNAVILDSLSGLRTYSTGSGSAGNITVEVPSGSLQVLGGSFINASSLSVGATASKAGDIGVVAGSVLISGHSTINPSLKSTISASSVTSNGGTIHIDANKVGLTDSQLTTSVSGGPQTVGGTITVDANNVKLTNSQMLSTATEGQGGTIDITSHALHQDANSVIDASSQFGTDGTVTIH